MAPELVRSTCFPGRGTQKGDVYSFALILFDLHSRRGDPWSASGLTPQGQPSLVSSLLQSVISLLLLQNASQLQPTISSRSFKYLWFVICGFA